MKRILLTGVSGFVGGALGARLRRSGDFHVTGISRRPPRPGAVDEHVQLDLAMPLPQGMDGFDTIVHAAGLVSPWGRPEDFQRNNVEATANIIRTAENSGGAHLVFISSSSVFYGEGDQFSITEETPLPVKPINMYAASKRLAEELVVTSGLDAAIIRPRAVFGVGDTVLLPRILRAARLRLLPRFTRPDGQRPVGDVISIDNLVHAIERAVRSRAIGAFNVTDGQPVDIYDFLGSVLSRLGLPSPRHNLPAGVSMQVAGGFEALSRTVFGWREPPITRYGVALFSQSKTFDISKARAAFGEPPVPTETALERFVAWQRESGA